MKDLFYENQAGEQVSVKRERINPMVKAYGAGPTEYKCKHCKHIIAKHFSKTYYKCEFRGNTNGPGTDHRVNWPTCGKFVKSED